MKKFLSLLLSIVMVFSCLSCFAIINVSATQDRTSYFNKNYTLTGNPIDDIVAVAQAQANRTKAQMGYTEAWCANFVGDCASLAGLGDIIPRNGYCGTLYSNILNAGGKEVTSPQKGDIIFYYCTASSCPNSGKPWVHVGIMTSPTSSIEGNSGGKVAVKSKVTYTDMNGHTYGHSGTNSVIAKYLRPNYPSQEPPKNPTISKNQIWYDLKDTIEIRAYADNATSYYMSMFKDGNRIKGEGVENGVFTMSASEYGIGNYSVYFSCTNSLNSVDTSWIDFSVVGDPTYTDVYTSNWWYDLSDTVSISVDTICAKGQVIGIDKDGIGRILTQQCDSTFTIPASDLGVGEYSAYFSVYNGSGGIDTKRVTFGIVDKPKDGAVVTTSKNSYTLEDTVSISVLAYCTKGQVIGIDKNGVERVVTENCGTTYKIPATQLGRGIFSAYFSIYNGSGGYDTERIEFAIDNPIINPKISIDKSIFDINDKINIKASAEGDVNKYTLIVSDESKNVVKKMDFVGHEISLNAKDFSVGTYTLRVNCSNYAFNMDTNELSLKIVDNSVPDNKLGDINGDGSVSVMDATMIQKHLANLITLPDDRLECADANKDGVVSVMDATQIQRYLAQLITEF